MRMFFDWLQDRTGYQDILHEALYEKIPGGARWRYVWGSTLVFTFAVQVITGLFLWTAYSPSAQTAWESVYFIQHEMTVGNVPIGKILRGVHHYTSGIMVVLMAIHLMQVIIDGAYKAPREINFWVGLILMQIVLGLSLTGYLLPWDQKGYYATQVTTKIVGATPVIGPELQELAQGGTRYGHHTLTRFFAMHAGILPGLLIVFLGLHLYVFRRHGITAPDPDRAPTATFWPDQVLKDGVACLGVLAVILLCAIFQGAELSAPANPTENFSAARPEWYFLFLFRFLRFEAVEHFGLAFGALYVPGAIMAVIALMPIIAYFKGGHRFNVVFMSIVAIAVLGLTGTAIIEDARDEDHQAALREAARDAERIHELASLPDKIPVEGAGKLLRDDPFTQGPRLFAKHCSACHRYDGHNGRGSAVMQLDPETQQAVVAPPSASDLAGFGNREWWRAILVDFEQHFAPTARLEYESVDSDNMSVWSNESREVFLDPENASDVKAMIEYFVSLSGRTDLEIDSEQVAKGEEIVSSGELTNGEFRTCDNCHASVGSEFELETDNGGYPELNEYGSAKWLKAFIRNAGSPQFYGDQNKMPEYPETKLSERELDLLVRWMTGDYADTEVEPYPSFGSDVPAAELESSSE